MENDIFGREAKHIYFNCCYFFSLRSLFSVHLYKTTHNFNPISTINYVGWLFEYFLLWLLLLLLIFWVIFFFIWSSYIFRSGISIFILYFSPLINFWMPSIVNTHGIDCEQLNINPCDTECMRECCWWWGRFLWCYFIYFIQFRMGHTNVRACLWYIFNFDASIMMMEMTFRDGSDERTIESTISRYQLLIYNDITYSNSNYSQLVFFVLLSIVVFLCCTENMLCTRLVFPFEFFSSVCVHIIINSLFCARMTFQL